MLVGGGFHGLVLEGGDEGALGGAVDQGADHHHRHRPGQADQEEGEGESRSAQEDQAPHREHRADPAQVEGRQGGADGGNRDHDSPCPGLHSETLGEVERVDGQEQPEDDHEHDEADHERHRHLGPAHHRPGAPNLVEGPGGLGGATVLEDEPGQGGGRQRQGVETEGDTPTGCLGDHSRQERQHCQPHGENRGVATHEPGAVGTAPVVADQDHRQVDQAGRSHPLEKARRQQQLEGGGEGRQGPERPEDGQAGGEDGPPSPPVGQEADDGGDEDPRHRPGCHQQSRTAVGHAQVGEDVGDGGGDQGGVEDPRQGDGEDEDQGWAAGQDLARLRGARGGAESRQSGVL